MSRSTITSGKTISAMFASIFLLGAFSPAIAVAAEDLPPAVHWIPQDAVISLEVTQPKPLLDLLTGEKATAAVTALPAYQRQASQPKFQEFLNLINFLELTLQTDWRNALTKLTGGGITFAICREDTVLLIVAERAVFKHIDLIVLYTLSGHMKTMESAAGHLCFLQLVIHGVLIKEDTASRPAVFDSHIVGFIACSTPGQVNSMPRKISKSHIPE